MTLDPAAARRRSRPARIGWRIFWLVVGFGAVGAFQQKGVTIAAERIMPELSLTQMQIGWLQWAFILGYAPLQLMGGWIGDRFGARRALSSACVLAVLATIALPLAPMALSGTALFAGLFLSQWVLGIAQSPIYPVGAGVVRAWMPSARWGFANGVQSMGLQLGAAATPLVIAALMQLIGWQRALFWTALPALGLAAGWAWYARNQPRDHPSISRSELDELEPPAATVSDAAQAPVASLRGVFRQDVMLLALSYLMMNYVFYLLGNWSFLYLVQERHFSVIEGGLLAVLPPLAAAFGAGLGGGLTDALRRRFGARWGYRFVPLTALPLVALLLVIAVYVPAAVLAVTAMTLCYGIIELTEASYWTATMQVSPRDTMLATGLLNTGGSCGGLVGIPIVAYLSGHGQWRAAFLLGALLAMLSAALWLGVDAQRPSRVGNRDVS